MKRFKITEVEVQFLEDMVEYLDNVDNSVSSDGKEQLKIMFDKIKSRPDMNLVIDMDSINAPDEVITNG